ncbi:hypothetical protein LTR12_010997 [Friedmanniomyces endolithicus]|nr:hypothetical protein LTR12_010997 [Friedmanniomyces endolithicus]
MGSMADDADDAARYLQSISRKGRGRKPASEDRTRLDTAHTPSLPTTPLDATSKKAPTPAPRKSRPWWWLLAIPVLLWSALAICCAHYPRAPEPVRMLSIKVFEDPLSLATSRLTAVSFTHHWNHTTGRILPTTRRRPKHPASTPPPHIDLTLPHANMSRGVERTQRQLRAVAASSQSFDAYLVGTLLPAVSRAQKNPANAVKTVQEALRRVRAVSEDLATLKRNAAEISTCDAESEWTRQYNAAKEYWSGSSLSDASANVYEVKSRAMQAAIQVVEAQRDIVIGSADVSIDSYSTLADLLRGLATRLSDPVKGKTYVASALRADVAALLSATPASARVPELMMHFDELWDLDIIAASQTVRECFRIVPLHSPSGPLSTLAVVSLPASAPAYLL